MGIQRPHDGPPHRLQRRGPDHRKDYGLMFNMMLDGKFIVSDEVQIMIEGEFVEK